MALPFRGWAVVAAAFVVLLVAYGAQFSFGVFFNALLEEFGWSRAGLSGVFTLYVFGYCTMGFPAGRLTDRWGPRVVIRSGAVLLGGALMAMAGVTRLWQPYVLYGGLAAVGMGTVYVPCNATVVKWFVRRRGLAVGIASAGASVGTFALPPLAQFLVGTVGWRRAYLGLGLAVLVVLTLIATVMRRDPESVGLHPDGDAGGTPVAPGPDAAPDAWPLSRLARLPGFWLLAASFGATWAPVFIPVVHLIRFARDLGFTPQTGAWVVSVLGLGGVVGRVAMGVISDRMGRRATVAVSMALQAVAFLGLAATRGLGGLCASAALFGFSYGAVTALFPAVVGDFFGRRRAGTLVGVFFALAGSVTACGPLLGGAVYDATGAYTWAFVIGGALNVMALVLLLMARPPAIFADEPGPVLP